MQRRTFIQYVIISLKGIAMGAADVVPGVSGGTIAFISGIYEELLGAISAVNLHTLKLVLSGKFKEAWKRINGNFLFALLIGIFISILSLAKLISWALENKPVLVWSFFFGLVLASIVFVGKQINSWKLHTVLLFIVGAVVAYYITTLQPMVTTNTSLIFIFLAGSVAICAMILPGISGAFILVLLGAYKLVLDAIHDRDVKTLLILIAGGITGLLTFSKILKWLFSKFRNEMLAVLTGFILGSLNKIWPWKEIIDSKVIGDKEVVIKEMSVSPVNYDGNPQLGIAILLALVGFCVILLLEKMAKVNK